MNYEERDSSELYYQLPVAQQDFVDELLFHIGNAGNITKVHRLVMSSLFDCLMDRKPRCIMEAIAASATIDSNNPQRQNLVYQAKQHGILSRDELRLYRSFERPRFARSGITFREYVDSLKNNPTSSLTSTDQGFSCTANTDLGMDLKLKKVFDYRDIIKTLEKIGCTVAARGRGAHETWYNPLSDLYFTVVITHGSDSKVMRIDTLSRILVAAHITYDEFASHYYN